MSWCNVSESSGGRADSSEVNSLEHGDVVEEVEGAEVPVGGGCDEINEGMFVWEGRPLELVGSEGGSEPLPLAVR